MTKSAILKTITVALLLALVALIQSEYDAVKIAPPPSSANPFSPETVRMFDLGFHSAAASFLWISTMPEILDLFNNKTEYLSDRAYLNDIDPKLSYPYAFSVLTLPAIPTSTGYLSGSTDSLAIGEEGLANADPDWRIPYYMATNYYLQFKDLKDALIYFNLAAETPGIPYYAKRFAQNFGAEQKDRDRTRGLWESIRDTTNDPDTKARAQAYIDQLDDFDYLEAAAAQYKKMYGKEPSSTQALVDANIIPAIPEDPFGYIFVIGPDGTAAVDLAIPTSTGQ